MNSSIDEVEKDYVSVISIRQTTLRPSGAKDSGAHTKGRDRTGGGVEVDVNKTETSGGRKYTQLASQWT